MPSTAIATVERVDVLVRWNFQQIVNLDRIRAFNAANLKPGYPILEISLHRLKSTAHLKLVRLV